MYISLILITYDPKSAVLLLKLPLYELEISSVAMEISNHSKYESSRELLG